MNICYDLTKLIILRFFHLSATLYIFIFIFLFQCAIFAALFAVAMARPDGPPPPAYAPAPYHPPAKGYAPEKLPPQPFAYQYGVADDYSGANFEKAENQDASGNLQGSYRVNLPDGRVQIVTYTADHHNGFVADVKYEGTAVYPEEKPYKPAPKYAPAPPKYAPAPPKYVPA